MGYENENDEVLNVHCRPNSLISGSSEELVVCIDALDVAATSPWQPNSRIAYSKQNRRLDAETLILAESPNREAQPRDLARL